MNFLWPEALFLALAAPLLALVFYSRRPKAVPGVARAGRWQKHVPPGLYFAALLVAALAAARPTALLTLPSQQRTWVDERRALLYKYSPAHESWGRAVRAPELLGRMTERQRQILEPPYIWKRPPIPAEQ